MDPKQEKKAFQEAKQKASFVSKSGMPYVCFVLEEAQGNALTTLECIRQMNAPIVKPDGTVVRDISGIGKLAVSVNDSHLVVVAYVPKGKELDATEWIKELLSGYDTTVKNVNNTAWAVIHNDPDKDIYVFKLRDELISKSYSFLRRRRLIGELEDDEELLGEDVFQ